MRAGRRAATGHAARCSRSSAARGEPHGIQVIIHLPSLTVVTATGDPLLIGQVILRQQLPQELTN
jgi:hypothetical protein